MRLPPAILGNAEEVLREILRFTAPADVTLSRYFKDHPRLGGRERGAIAECVYAVLRNKSFFTDFAGAGATVGKFALKTTTGCSTYPEVDVNVTGLWLLQETLRTWERAGSPTDLEALVVQRFPGVLHETHWFM